MHKKHKVYLIFSIIYWLLVIGSLILFGFAFGKVHINKYGLLRNYYNSWISKETYISGLYHTGIGCYFIQFPSSKVYLTDQKLNVTNYDMNSMQITYTLVYRIIKDQVYNLYVALSTNYQNRIIANVNGIISNYFISKNQQQSRTTLQEGLVNEIISKFGLKVPILKSAIQISGFWLNQIDFFSMEASYQTAYLQTAVLSQAYEVIQVQKMKTDMQIQILKNSIENLKNQLVYTANQAQRNASLVQQSSAEFQKAKRKLILSKQFNSSQLFQYYQSPKISLT